MGWLIKAIPLFILSIKPRNMFKIYGNIHIYY